MIRLNLPREPRWLDLGYGVSVLIKPITTAIHRAAIATAYRKALAIAEERGLITEAGGTISDIPDPTDQDGINGLRTQFMLQDLAVHAIVKWRGVGNAEGTADAPVTPANVATFIRDFPVQAAAFESAYLHEIAQMDAEGNASAGAPNGIGVAAPATVDDATHHAAKNAPITSTPSQP